MVSAQRLTGVGRLLETLEGPIRYELLKWALESGVFDLCQNPATPERLSERMNFPADTLALALRALVAAGFMEADGTAFSTAADILPFVASGSARNMAETLHSMAGTRHAGLNQFADLVAGKASVPGKRLFDDAHWDASHRSLAAFHRAVAADTMEPCLTGLPEWPRARTLLEVGPGSAVLARRLTALRPNLEITLFDLPPVASRIANEASDMPFTVVPGTYNDNLPAGPFDIIWCSMSLYFHDKGLAALMARLADRLAPGGVLVSFHEALTPDRTGQPEHVLGRLLPALRQGDVSFTEGEIATAMSAAGLGGATHESLSTPFGRFRLDAARKEA